MPRPRFIAATFAALLLAMSLGAAVAAQDAAAPAPPVATPNPEPLGAPAGDGTAVRLTTELGDIVIGLFNESAPVAAENLNLAEAGFYDGVGFHRVVPGFVIQGGDPEGTGQGGPGYTIPDEEVVGEYGRGIVAMARTPEPDSQGSQFFVVVDDSAKDALDSARTYVIFGRVLEGMDVVDAIVAQGPAADLIEDPVRILSASVEQAELPPEPTAEPPSEAEAAAQALADLLPDEVAGLTLQKDTYTTDEIFGGSDDATAIEELRAIAAEHGVDVDSLVGATAGAQDGEAFALLFASRLPGLDVTLIEAPLTRVLLGDTSSLASTKATVGGREATVLEQDSGDLIHIFRSGDLLLVVLADPDSLEEVVAALP
jgi:cyclophilin family peptidyl-prolyl cis-trans isomerase